MDGSCRGVAPDHGQHLNSGGFYHANIRGLAAKRLELAAKDRLHCDEHGWIPWFEFISVAIGNKRNPDPKTSSGLRNISEAMD